MPDQITNRGTNDQGNHWDTRQDSAGSTGYHYSNSNDSYYYQNTNGSTYYNDGKGFSQYTSSSGDKTNSYSSKK